MARQGYRWARVLLRSALANRPYFDGLTGLDLGLEHRLGCLNEQATREPQQHRRAPHVEPASRAFHQAASETGLDQTPDKPPHQTRRTSTTVRRFFPRRRPSRYAIPMPPTAASAPKSLPVPRAASAPARPVPCTSRNFASRSSRVIGREVDLLIPWPSPCVLFDRVGPR